MKMDAEKRWKQDVKLYKIQSVKRFFFLFFFKLYFLDFYLYIHYLYLFIVLIVEEQENEFIYHMVHTPFLHKTHLLVLHPEMIFRL
jgi:hypothetical protein